MCFLNSCLHHQVTGHLFARHRHLRTKNSYHHLSFVLAKSVFGIRGGNEGSPSDSIDARWGCSGVLETSGFLWHSHHLKCHLHHHDLCFHWSSGQLLRDCLRSEVVKFPKERSLDNEGVEMIPQFVVLLLYCTDFWRNLGHHHWENSLTIHSRHHHRLGLEKMHLGHSGYLSVHSANIKWWAVYPSLKMGLLDSWAVKVCTCKN